MRAVKLPERTAAKTPRVPDKALAYSVTDAAAVLGVGRSTMFALIAAGDIKSLLVKRRRLVSHAALEAFIAKQERKAA